VSGRIGLKGVGMHRFRHMHATELRRAGADLAVVQQAMRHRSLATTQIYTLVESRERREAVLALPLPSAPQRTS
jgi:integrase/recombinase XerD